MKHMSNCDFISDYENWEVVNIDDFREITEEERNIAFDTFLEELDKFVIYHVVADGDKLRTVNELNGFSRWELANIFMDATYNDFGYIFKDVDSIAVDIDELIPLAYCGFDTREINYASKIEDTDLVYRYHENYELEGCTDSKHLKGINHKQVEIPQSIKGYRYIKSTPHKV